jgi:hypothetical protein
MNLLYTEKVTFNRVYSTGQAPRLSSRKRDWVFITTTWIFIKTYGFPGADFSGFGFADLKFMGGI